jgi:hypothetical protein
VEAEANNAAPSSKARGEQLYKDNAVPRAAEPDAGGTPPRPRRRSSRMRQSLAAARGAGAAKAQLTTKGRLTEVRTNAPGSWRRARRVLCCGEPDLARARNARPS